MKTVSKEEKEEDEEEEIIIPFVTHEKGPAMEKPQKEKEEASPHDWEEAKAHGIVHLGVGIHVTKSLCLSFFK